MPQERFKEGWKLTVKTKKKKRMTTIDAAFSLSLSRVSTFDLCFFGLLRAPDALGCAPLNPPPPPPSLSGILSYFPSRCVPLTQLLQLL